MSDTQLDFITVRGFKSISSLEKVKLRAVNLLIGANGSGKSNFIEVFSLLHSIREGHLQQYVRKAGGADRLLHFGSKSTSELELFISFSDQVNQYRVLLRPTDDDSFYLADERTYFWDKTRYPDRPYDDSLSARKGGLEAGISDPSLHGSSIANWIRHRLDAWRLYHVHDTSSTSPMRKTAKVDDNEFLRPDGSNLSSFLYLLKERHPASYSLIRNSVRRVAPFFEDFRLRPDSLNKSTIRLSWRHRNSDQYFGAAALSDGSLRFIALATLFLQPHNLRPSIIVVDEPELGLHPYAIALLASLIKQAASETQVILSTQSSLLLDYFEPEDVLVAERVSDATELRRLKPGPLKEWLEDYSLGQLWEKNEIGGRPGLREQ